jgi:hypothetical protein
MRTKTDTPRSNQAMKNVTIKRLAKGFTVKAAVGSDYVRLLDPKTGNRVAQLADRRGSTAILENLPDEVEVPDTIPPVGEPSRMRFRVEESNVDDAAKVIASALDLIRKSTAARAKEVKARQDKKPAASKAKHPAAKKVGVKVTA